MDIIVINNFLDTQNPSTPRNSCEDPHCSNQAEFLYTLSDNVLMQHILVENNDILYFLSGANPERENGKMFATKALFHRLNDC